MATHCERLALAPASGAELNTTAGYNTEGLLFKSRLVRARAHGQLKLVYVVMVGLVGYSRAQAWAAVVC